MQLMRARFLVVGRHDPPGRVRIVGRPDHLVVGARVVPPAPVGFDVHRAKLPLAQRIVDTLPEAALLLLLADVEEVLQDLHAAFDDRRLEARREFEKAARLLLGAVAHDALDAGAVVPAAVEDHYLAGRRQLRDVALDIHLGLLAVGRRRQRHHPEYPRADPLGEALDDPALAGGVAALEDDHDPGARGLHPGLQVSDLDLQAGDLLLVGLLRAFLSPSPRLGRLGRLRLARSSCPWLASPCASSAFHRLLLARVHASTLLSAPCPSKARSASSRSSKTIAGPIRSIDARPARAGLRASACSSAMPSAMPAASEFVGDLLQHRGGSAVDLDDRASVEHEPARCRAAVRRRWPSSRALDVVGVEEQQAALNHADREPGTGRASGDRCSL